MFIVYVICQGVKRDLRASPRYHVCLILTEMIPYAAKKAPSTDMTIFNSLTLRTGILAAFTCVVARNKPKDAERGASDSLLGQQGSVGKAKGD